MGTRGGANDTTRVAPASDNLKVDLHLYLWRGDRVVEGAALEMLCTPKGYRGFDSRPLRHSTRSLRSLAHGRPQERRNERDECPERSRRAGSLCSNVKGLFVTWFVYILRCANDSYYVGHSTNTDRRLCRHLAGTGAQLRQFTAPRRSSTGSDSTLKRKPSPENDRSRVGAGLKRNR
jgi:hypothetical protein